MNKELLQQLNQRPIAYYPVYREITGSTTAGILLSQLMYWFSKKDKIFKIDADIMDETFLTKKELENAKKLIKNLDFITVSREGIPAKTFYAIDWNKYEISLSKTGKQVSPIGGNCTPPMGETIIVKSLTETTTENIKIYKKNKTLFPTNDSELKSYAITKASHQNINCPIQTYETFKDHHLAKGSKFLDWQSAFNTWVRNFFKYNNPNPKELVCLTDSDNLTGIYNFDRGELNLPRTNQIILIPTDIFIKKVLEGLIISTGTTDA